MSKDQFDDLKKRLQEYEDASNTDGYDSSLESKIDKNPYFIPDQLKIMDSGIFYEGQLKGNQLTGKAKKYEKYPISDIDNFVQYIAATIHHIDRDGSNYSCGFVSQLVSKFQSVAYEYTISVILKRFGISKVNKLEVIKKKIIELNEEIRSELTFGDKRAIHQNCEILFSIFKGHIPDAPNKAISDSISELLKKFEIEVKSGTILQRIRRAKK
jgi:hypothetical protein